MYVRKTTQGTSELHFTCPKSKQERDIKGNPASGDVCGLKLMTAKDLQPINKMTFSFIIVSQFLKTSDKKQNKT